MTITSLIQNQVSQLPAGFNFGYQDFDLDKSKQEAGIKALNRMVEAGMLAKIGKGRFYKPESSPFGQLLPNYEQVIQDLIKKNGQAIGYLTGINLFNQLGFTTQLSNDIQIAKNDVRPSMKRLHYNIRFIRQKNTINEQNIPLLQLLDVIRFIKEIPDSNLTESIKRLLALLAELTFEEQRQMTELANLYPPSARALLGLMWEYLGIIELSQSLYQTLNPVTKYQYGNVRDVLPNQEKWNIQ